MKTSNISLIVVIASFLAVSGPANAFNCYGSACDDVFFSWVNDCYVAKNNSSKRIRVTQGPYSYLLQAGESKTNFGRPRPCIASYQGFETANYE